MSGKLALMIAMMIVLAGMLGLTFDVQTVEAGGTIYIRADGTVEGTEKIQRDGFVYTFTDNINDSIIVERDNVVVDGAGYTLQRFGSGWYSVGFSIHKVNGVAVKNVTIKEFWCGIAVSNSCYNSFSGNHIACDHTGIRLYGSSNNNYVYQNEITNNFIAIDLEHSANNMISGNNILNNTYGVNLWNCPSNNTVSRNNIIANAGWGIGVYRSFNNTIYRNNVTSNPDGIMIRESSCNIIHDNEIANNDWRGIDIYNSSNNTIYGNMITYSEAGVGLTKSSNNRFYHNNFLNNGKHVSFRRGEFGPSVCVWDNGVEGNYWHNYTGVDLHSGQYQNATGSDGIGDTLHVLDIYIIHDQYGNPTKMYTNEDNYPLMGMFYSFKTVHNYQVDFVSNSSISYCAFSLINSTHATIDFDVIGKAETQGFCRIRVPRALINGSYVVKFNGGIITYPQVRELPCSDETHGYFYINYAHSEHTIEISGTTTIPEFPSILILLTFMIATLLVVVVYRRKLH